MIVKKSSEVMRHVHSTLSTLRCFFLNRARAVVLL